MKNELIPAKVAGKNTDLNYSATANTLEEAMLMYKKAFNRLLNPATWHQLAGSASADFVLVSKEAHIKNSLAAEGDYFRIDIPGPGLKAGEGFDWVRVETITTFANETEDMEGCGLKVRPAAPPQKKDATTAHFFKKGATSTFIIKRKGKKLTASYHGRNEIPNKDSDVKVDNIRNTLVALGAVAGLSELQWQALLQGFLDTEEVV